MDLYDVLLAKQLSGGGGGAAPVIEALSVTANGTYTAPSGVDGYSPVTVDVAGGATNLVTGEFTVTSASTMNIDLPYTGNGYPIALFIFPNKGSSSADNGITSAVAQYGITQYIKVKADFSTPPNYSSSGDRDEGSMAEIHKSSSSSTTSYSATYQRKIYIYKSSASASAEASATFISSTRLQIAKRTNSYGFIEGGNYAYVVLYSE